MKTIALFLNGEKPQSIPDLAQYDQIYCTDGAYNYLNDINITPNLIIGDFDSILTLPKDVPHKHVPDQNFTDFEKAVKIIITQGYKNIDVFAANGLEQDHFLGNMSTALKYKSQINIHFFDDLQSYFFMDKKLTLNDVLGKTISLFPFPQAKKVVSTGLKYPLKQLDLDMVKNKIGTRNQAVKNTITINFSQGNLLIFIEI